ncbi:hypothetical protein DFJ58DRAFT_844973 [Suillus subalutaceus]|uniref:uncharacterized protein n=1 Tax=Suillus subalutaceus TaxID=48586 RepID=UPI001B873D50|nr:uncharacterized protein DFJ58DRAFT_844973 [Suillus subalutaceus]KAG1841549.1 hypothetical protein DFJ58DRAFT_844973 [Suillus subalutaceus]
MIGIPKTRSPDENWAAPVQDELMVYSVPGSYFFLAFSRSVFSVFCQGQAFQCAAKVRLLNTLPSSGALEKLIHECSHNQVQALQEKLTSAPFMITGALEKLTSAPFMITGALEKLTSAPFMITGALEKLTSAPFMITGVQEKLTSAPFMITGALEKLTSAPFMIIGELVDKRTRLCRIGIQYDGVPLYGYVRWRGRRI